MPRHSFDPAKAKPRDPQRALVDADLRAYQAHVAAHPRPPGSVAECLAFALEVRPTRGTCWVETDPFRAVLTVLPATPGRQDLDRAADIGSNLFQFLHQRGRLTRRELAFALEWLPAAIDAVQSCLEIGLTTAQIRELEPELRGEAG